MGSSLPDLSLLPADRLDPVTIIEEQNATRLQELVPVRIGRMLQSPFAFYRGTAALMAADLARTPNSGHVVLACGDAPVELRSLCFPRAATPVRPQRL